MKKAETTRSIVLPNIEQSKETIYKYLRPGLNNFKIWKKVFSFFKFKMFFKFFSVF